MQSRGGAALCPPSRSSLRSRSPRSGSSTSSQAATCRPPQSWQALPRRWQAVRSGYKQRHGTCGVNVKDRRNANSDEIVGWVIIESDESDEIVGWVIITKTARRERPSHRFPRWPSLGSQVQMSSSAKKNVQTVEISGAALTSEVLVLIVAMIEEALGTGETGDALNALPQHVWTIPTRARPVL